MLTLTCCFNWLVKEANKKNVPDDGGVAKGRVKKAPLPFYQQTSSGKLSAT